MVNSRPPALVPPLPQNRWHLRWIFRLFKEPTWSHGEGAYIGWESEDKSLWLVWEETGSTWAPYPAAEPGYGVPVTETLSTPGEGNGSARVSLLCSCRHGYALQRGLTANKRGVRKQPGLPACS